MVTQPYPIAAEGDERGKEVAQLVAELETTFKLPVISPSLKKRYEHLQQIQKKVAKLEDEYANVSATNSANSSALQILTQRRNFLAGLYQSLLGNTKLSRDATLVFSAAETKIKEEIMQLEEALKGRENALSRLKHQLKIEEARLQGTQINAESNQDIIEKREEDLNALESQKAMLESLFAADQKVVKEMENYFFKMTSNLFELQREFDKRTLHLTHEASDHDDKINSNKLHNGWHRISHIMEEMGKDQVRYLKQGISESVEESWSLGEEERGWLAREIMIQKQQNDEGRDELSKLVKETKTNLKKFIETVEKTETLLKQYAEVECKNMTVDLRNARLQILAAATKYEPETPMYKKYYATIKDSAMSVEKPEYQELYARKKTNAAIAQDEAQRYEEIIRKQKVAMRKELYWLDKRDRQSQEMSKIEESLEKMDPILLKEFLRALILGGKLPDAKLPEILPDTTAAELIEFLKQMMESRNRQFEVHLKNCSQIYANDIKKVSDEAADLENGVRSFEKTLSELSKESEKEKIFCSRLEERIKIIEAKAAKRKAEVKVEDERNEARWQQEVTELQQKLESSLKARDKAKREKLEIQEAIRAAKIEEDNLRHRYNVFQSLQSAEKQGKKQIADSKRLLETEQQKNEDIRAETEAMASLLAEAQKQEKRLESAIEHSHLPSKPSPEIQALEAEKFELESELNYLTALEKKINTAKKL